MAFLRRGYAKMASTAGEVPRPILPPLASQHHAFWIGINIRIRIQTGPNCRGRAGERAVNPLGKHGSINSIVT